MAKRVFFSFNFGRDNGRIGQVRNCWVTKNESPLLDKAQWETIKRKGDKSIQNWIDTQMRGTSVTIVLIGSATASRRWVKYEIKKSIELGNAIIGIEIHNLKDFRTSLTSPKGSNPFQQFNYGRANLSNLVDIYNWKNDLGYQNIGKWIDKAIKTKRW